MQVFSPICGLAPDFAFLTFHFGKFQTLTQVERSHDELYVPITQLQQLLTYGQCRSIDKPTHSHPRLF